MEISNPIIPNAATSQTSVANSSRLPVKADRYVDSKPTGLPNAGDDNNKNRRGVVRDNDENPQRSGNRVDNNQEDSQRRGTRNDGVDNQSAALQENPLVLARQRAGQLATLDGDASAAGASALSNSNEISTINNSQAPAQASQGVTIEAAEQLPRSIRTYLDTSKVNPDDNTVSRNIDFFI